MKHFLKLLLLSSFAATLSSCANDVSKEKIDISGKNLIIFIGDGMGQEQVKAGSLLYGDSFSFATWDKVLVNTNSIDSSGKPRGTTDSAAGGTALATGHLTTNGTIGLDAEGNVVENIMEYAKKLGKSTGIITTDSCTQATPSAFSAHVDQRGKGTDIIEAQVNSSIDLFITEDNSFSRSYEEKFSQNYTFTTDAKNLNSYKESDKLFALANFSEYGGDDKLVDLVDFGIDFLEKNDNGYVLMIEQGYIDHNCHDNNFEGLAYALGSMAETVNMIANKVGEDTKMIITADHETGGLHVSDKANYGNTYKNVSYMFNATSHSNTEVFAFPYNFKIVPGAYSSLKDKTKLKNCDLFNIYKDIIG